MIEVGGMIGRCSEKTRHLVFGIWSATPVQNVYVSVTCLLIPMCEIGGCINSERVLQR